VRNALSFLFPIHTIYDKSDCIALQYLWDTSAVIFQYYMLFLSFYYTPWHGKVTVVDHAP